MLGTLIDLYILCIIGRIILSYFPLEPGSTGASIASFLFTITEPVLGPLRRMIPMAGPLDLSPMILIFALEFVVKPILAG